MIIFQYTPPISGFLLGNKSYYDNHILLVLIHVIAHNVVSSSLVTLTNPFFSPNKN